MQGAASSQSRDVNQPRAEAESKRMQGATSSQSRDVNQPRAAAEIKRMQGATSSQCRDVNQPRAAAEISVCREPHPPRAEMSTSPGQPPRDALVVLLAQLNSEA